MVEIVVRVFGDRALLATLVQQWAHEQVQLPRASALDGAAVLRRRCFIRHRRHQAPLLVARLA